MHTLTKVQEEPHQIAGAPPVALATAGETDSTGGPQTDAYGELARNQIFPAL